MGNTSLFIFLRGKTYLRTPARELRARAPHPLRHVTPLLLPRCTCSTPRRRGGDSRLRSLQPLVVCAGGTCDRLRSRAVGGRYARRGCFLGYRDRPMDSGEASSPRFSDSPRPFSTSRREGLSRWRRLSCSHQTLHQSLSETIVDGNSACFRFRNIGCVLP